MTNLAFDTGMREGGSYASGPPTALPGAARGTGTKPVPSCAYADAARELTKAGLTLEQATWQPKPGLARHMGVARRDVGEAARQA